MKLIAIILLGLIFYGFVTVPSFKEPNDRSGGKTNEPIAGADQTDKYLKYLKGKRIAVLANQTTIIGRRHLVDSLLSRGVQIVKVFGPEHGFRGNASNGAKVADEKDPATEISIISLYGSKRKPSATDLADVDLVVFDIQDVGCRFYTYINVLRDVMEACAEHDKELLILDRPNPNGYLVDGPVLEIKVGNWTVSDSNSPRNDHRRICKNDKRGRMATEQTAMQG
jgi:uncharacterized protein YbbC (DUF1343 family)